MAYIIAVNVSRNDSEEVYSLSQKASILSDTGGDCFCERVDPKIAECRNLEPYELCKQGELVTSQ